MRNIVHTTADYKFSLGHLGIDPTDPTFRDKIECAIEGLIDLLDEVDGDFDLEPETEEYSEIGA